MPLIEELVWNGSSGNNLVDMEALTRIFLRGEGGGDGQTRRYREGLGYET